MQTKLRHFVIALAAVAAAAPLAVESASAQRFGSGRVTIHGPAGTTTIDRSASGPAGARSGSTTVTGPYGGTATRDFSRQYDPATGSVTRHSQSTGPYGGTRAVTGTTTQTGPGEFSNTRTVTSPYGETRTVDRWIRVEPAN